MIDLNVLLKVYIGVLMVVIAVGPCWLTYANIAMNYGWKKGMLAMSGCMTIECIYWIIGVTAIHSVKSVVPDKLVLLLSLSAVAFLIYLSISIWRTDVDKIRAEKTNGRSNLAIYLKLVIMTLTSPMAIVGYASIYASIDNASNSVLSILLGSALASLSGHTAVVSMWSLIGKKINNKVMRIINKISAIFILYYSINLLYSILKKILAIGV